jgi:hypothetical protein
MLIYMDHIIHIVNPGGSITVSDWSAQGDTIAGGSTRTPQMTAYRQQALAVANALAGTSRRPRDLRMLGSGRPQNPSK